MNSVERVKAICAERKIPIYKLETVLQLYLAIHFPTPQNTKICKRICK